MLKRVSRNAKNKPPAPRPQEKKPEKANKTPDRARRSSYLEEYADRDSFTTAEEYLEELKREKAASKKNKGGRPSVMKPDVVRKLEHALVYDVSVEAACLMAGISRQTYYDFLKRCPKFADRIADLREAVYARIQMNVMTEAEVNPEFGMRVLERRRRTQWATRQEVAHEGAVTNRHEVDPKTAALIKSAMGSFGKKVKQLQDAK